MKHVNIVKFFCVFSLILILGTVVLLKTEQSINAQSSSAPVTWTNLTNASANTNSIQHSGTGYFAKVKLPKQFREQAFLSLLLTGN